MTRNFDRLTGTILTVAAILSAVALGALLGQHMASHSTAAQVAQCESMGAGYIVRADGSVDCIHL